MCFGGLIGVTVNVDHKKTDPISTLFAEEVGWVLEVDKKNTDYVVVAFRNSNVPVYRIGVTSGYGMNSKV